MSREVCTILTTSCLIVYESAERIKGTRLEASYRSEYPGVKGTKELTFSAEITYVLPVLMASLATRNTLGYLHAHGERDLESCATRRPGSSPGFPTT